MSKLISQIRCFKERNTKGESKGHAKIVGTNGFFLNKIFSPHLNEKSAGKKMKNIFSGLWGAPSMNGLLCHI